MIAFRRAGPCRDPAPGDSITRSPKSFFAAASPQAVEQPVCSAVTSWQPNAAAVGGPPIRIETPRQSLIVTNPASSVTSSPANTGCRPANGGSSRNAAIALPLSTPGGLARQTILPCSRTARLGFRPRQLGGRAADAASSGALRPAARRPCPRQHAAEGPRKRGQAATRALEHRRVGYGSLDLQS